MAMKIAFWSGKTFNWSVISNKTSCYTIWDGRMFWREKKWLMSNCIDMLWNESRFNENMKLSLNFEKLKSIKTNQFRIWNCIWIMYRKNSSSIKFLFRYGATDPSLVRGGQIWKPSRFIRFVLTQCDTCGEAFINVKIAKNKNSRCWNKKKTLIIVSDNEWFPDKIRMFLRRPLGS